MLDGSKPPPVLSDMGHLKVSTEGTWGSPNSASGSRKTPEEVTYVLGVDFAVHSLFICQAVLFIIELLDKFRKYGATLPTLSNPTPSSEGVKMAGAHRPNSPVAPFLSTGNSQRDPQQLD